MEWTLGQFRRAREGVLNGLHEDICGDIVSAAGGCEIGFQRVHISEPGSFEKIGGRFGICFSQISRKEIAEGISVRHSCLVGQRITEPVGQGGSRVRDCHTCVHGGIEHVIAVVKGQGSA